MSTPHKVSVLDLTAEQIEAIEDELDVPVSQWGSRGSVVRTMRLVLEAGNGVEHGTYKSLTAKRILELAALDDTPDADPNP